VTLLESGGNGDGIAKPAAKIPRSANNWAGGCNRGIHEGRFRFPMVHHGGSGDFGTGSACLTIDPGCRTATQRSTRAGLPTALELKGWLRPIRTMSRCCGIFDVRLQFKEELVPYLPRNGAQNRNFARLHVERSRENRRRSTFICNANVCGNFADGGASGDSRLICRNSWTAQVSSIYRADRTTQAVFVGVEWRGCRCNRWGRMAPWNERGLLKARSY